jgi:hypothetical protein
VQSVFVGSDGSFFILPLRESGTTKRPRTVYIGLSLWYNSSFPHLAICGQDMGVCKGVLVCKGPPKYCTGTRNKFLSTETCDSL